jgi:hypothetical protein
MEVEKKGSEENKGDEETWIVVDNIGELQKLFGQKIV